MKTERENDTKTSERTGTERKYDYSNMDLIIGALGGIGAFTLAKGLVKTIVHTSNPIAILGLGVLECTAAIYGFAGTSVTSAKFGKAVERTKSKFKADENEETEDGYNDHVTLK